MFVVCVVESESGVSSTAGGKWTTNRLSYASQVAFIWGTEWSTHCIQCVGVGVSSPIGGDACTS